MSQSIAGVKSPFIIKVFSQAKKNNISYFSKFFPSGNPKLSKQLTDAQIFHTILPAYKVHKELTRMLPLRELSIASHDTEKKRIQNV